MGILNSYSDGILWLLLFIVGIGFIIYYFRTLSFHRKLHKQENKTIETLAERNKAYIATTTLNAIILQTLDLQSLTERIANTIPGFLGYQTGVLAVVDEKKRVLKRIAVSNTPSASAALKSLEVPFHDIEIGLDETENYCIKALLENKIYITTHLFDVLRPAISEENATRVQEAMHTRTTLVYPLYSPLDKKPLGTFLVSVDKPENQISEFEKQTLSSFVDGVRIALVNATLYTDLERTTKELQIANERLQELDKLKDDFVSIASHELRTPMTVIKSYVWMILNKEKINKKTKLYLDKTKVAVERLINLVNNMLNVSRIESGRITVKLEPVDLVVLAKEVVEEIEPRSKELQLVVKVIEPSVMPLVLCDKEKIREIYLNLIGNAMKFTPASGSIKITFIQRDPFVYTTVTDSGVGIEPEDLKKLFTKFGRLQNSYSSIAETRGTGLGLYISKSIVNIHKGTIEVRSEGKGKGSQFTFNLPIVDSDVARKLEQEAPKEESNAPSSNAKP